MIENLKKRWFSIPTSIRKPIVLVVGLLFVIAAGLTGWLPGPGGSPLFLSGVAILATEFVWAERLKQWVLGLVHRLGAWWRQNKLLGTLAFVGFGAAFLALTLSIYGLMSRLL